MGRSPSVDLEPERRRGPAVVTRAALLDVLDRGAAGPLTLVAAPAGSGKTVLVRAWLAARGRPAAWVSVERDERDDQRFWRELVRALVVAAPAGLQTVVPRPTPGFDGDALVRSLVPQLAALRERLVLVLDDLHELADAGVLEQLRYLLDHLPDTVHVVLITRRDVQVGLHRHRLAGRLTELRSADLRFTLEQTGEVLAGSGVALSEEGLAQLWERTEGWAAGVRMAALALAAHPAPERLVAEFSGSHRTVAEYLLAEVLDGLPPQVRRLLVRSAVLERVNGPLADLLTGGSHAEDELRALADDGVFVVALDGGAEFRFHHLFADLLALELRHTEPEQIPGLHRLAARWFDEHDRPIEAITHAEAAGDREQAVGLLMQHYFGLVLDGRRATARGLVDRFTPDPTSVSAPEMLSVIAAEELVSGSLVRAQAHLALAERQAAAVPAGRRARFASSLLLTRLQLARRRGDHGHLPEVPPPGVEPPDDARDLRRHGDVRAATLLSLGILECWSGRVTEGVRHLDEAVQLSVQIDRPYLEVECRAQRAFADAATSFSLARTTGRQVVALAETYGWGGDPVAGAALVIWGATLVHAGRLAEAGPVLARADAALRPDLEPGLGIVLHAAHGTAHAAVGDHAAAAESFGAAERLNGLLVNSSPLRLQLRCLLLIADVHAGRPAAAVAELGTWTAEERDTGEAREVRAVLALAAGDAGAAVAALAPTLAGDAPVHHVLVEIRSLLLDALARDLLADPWAAEAAVERALDLAEPDALVSPFLDVPCRALLARHPSHRTAHGAFLAEVLDVLSGTAPRQVALPRGPSPHLSDAELRVLRLLPTNLPVSAIAGQVYVSANTVKTHLKHIYTKLDAHNRVEAVVRARELGLLGSSARQR